MPSPSLKSHPTKFNAHLESQLTLRCDGIQYVGTQEDNCWHTSLSSSKRGSRCWFFWFVCLTTTASLLNPKRSPSCTPAQLAFAAAATCNFWVVFSWCQIAVSLLLIIILLRRARWTLLDLASGDVGFVTHLFGEGHMAFARAYRGMRRDARTLAPDEIALILASIKRAPTRTLSQQFRATTRRIVLCATVMGFTILQKVLFQMLLVSTVGFSHALTVVTNFVFIIFFLSGLSFQHRKAAEGQRLSMKFVQSNIQLFVGTGLTEAVAFTMFPWASVRVPGAMHPIIQQALLPLTMIVNFIVLGRNYSGQQMLGVAIIIVGVLVQFAPALGQIMVTSASTESHATIQGAAAVVLIIAYGFIAISLTFKEVAFKRFAQDLACHWTSMWWMRLHHLHSVELWLPCGQQTLHC